MYEQGLFKLDTFTKHLGNSLEIRDYPSTFVES